MPPILRWIIGGALCCALVARPAWAGGPDDAASTARNWQFWTSASLLVPTPVGVYAPDTAPSPPGLGLTALFRSPGGAWSARASLDVSRYRASLGNVSYTMFFAGRARFCLRTRPAGSVQ
jgi:hypothetical protein